MRSISLRGFSLVLVFLLIAALGSSLIREVHAWGMTVTPPSQTIPPGGTATFSVSVFYTPPEAPLPPVNLLVSPPEIGITATFSPNGLPIPFTSIMTVHVDPSKPPGTYTLSVWANPAGTPFPGPGNKAASATVVVGAAAPFDFTLQLSPTMREVKRGETAHYDVIISYSHPMYSGTVITIQNVLGLGPGMAPHLSTAPPRLSISTTLGTPPGSYNIILVGSALGKTHDATATLIVTAEPPQQ
ncbi:MAG: hypothetical protein QW390_01275, partial [Candidatus Bathyarchaeia archaeon]